ncbi:MAG: Peptidase, (Fungalysin) family [Fibrobacteres bacterium]|nr:Peptidase, (Fungalysin) family [Fibrobacterota bacterium]
MAACLAVSCVDNADDSESYFRLEASADLMSYKRVTVILTDTLGGKKATLYDDTLPSLARLSRLPAGPYKGGTVRITILAYRGNRLAYREIRLYDGISQQVLSVDIFRDEGGIGEIPQDTSLTAKPARQAPTIAGLPSDTTVSIRDSVPLNADAVDADGDLAAYTWDCNGDGKAEDSAGLAGGRVRIRFGRAYGDSGTRVCILKVWDKDGRSAQGKVVIRVVQDAPVANAGADTQVVVGTAIRLHAKGEDAFGPILSREWKIGSEEFKAMTQQESTIQAPALPGDLVCILRVTDSDGLIALDTLIVRVVYNSDNTLSELKTDIGILQPPFRKSVLQYVVTLAPADSLLLFFPKPGEAHAQVAVSGPDPRMAGSPAFPIRTGDNLFSIQVTAQDGSILQYSVTVRR